MTKAAIEVAGVSKVFRIYPDLAKSRIKQAILYKNKFYREKVALDSVSFSVGKGEVVGVLGPNGAGKTTLLKIIAGISRPTQGQVTVDGRVVAVLALGLGFHPRLTGLQNIDLAGMMLGMSRAEIRAKRDWIIDFAELEDSIGDPLTSYSSGMRARLSFAVAACQDPEILIIDEALATGDVRFVQKCIDRIHAITTSGATAMFVSHSIWSIKRMTSRCVVIDKGKIVDDGETSRVADNYQEMMLHSDGVEKGEGPRGHAFVGTGEVSLKRAALRDSMGRDIDIVEPGKPATILFELECKGKQRNVGLSVALCRADGITATRLAGVAGGALDDRGSFSQSIFKLDPGFTTVSLKFESLFLAPGDFSVDLQVFDPERYSGAASDQQYFFKTRVIEFGVRRSTNPNRSIVYYQPAIVSVGSWSEPNAS